MFVLATIGPALGADQIWEGEVVLTRDDINVTGIGGDIHSVGGKSALGALIKASEAGEFEVSLDTSLWDLLGPVVESIGGVYAEDNRSWRYWVNYPDEPVPLDGPDLFELKDGDNLTFYLGDRHALPFDSPRINVTADILLKKPEVLFITAENHPVIREASKEAVLNVALTS